MNIEDIQKGFRESIRRLFVKDRAPEEFRCPTCGCLTTWERLPFTGPWSGVVSCGKCSYRESVTKYLMDSIVSVQRMQFLTVDEIKNICETVRCVGGPDVRWALTGGASLIWLGATKRPTMDLDFVADEPLPLVPEEEHPNGYRYEIAGRRVDWTVQRDDRKPLFDEALSAAFPAESIPLIPLNFLVAFKLSSTTSSEKHLNDIAFIRRHLFVDLQIVAYLIEKYNLPPLCTCGEDENKDPDKALPHKTYCPKA